MGVGNAVRFWGLVLALFVAASPAMASTPLLTQETKLTVSTLAAGDQLGSAVSISGTTAVVGAPGDGTKGTNAGAAYVFVRSTSGWALQQKLLPQTGDGAVFGNSVAISGDTIVVGAYGDGTNGSFAGAAYVFVRSGATWSLQQELTAPDGVALDLFGYSVALSSNTLAVGAFGRSDRGGSSGAVYVFLRTGTTWSLQQKIVPADGAAGDQFGISVALDGDTLVSGAAGASNGTVATGTAYVHVRNGAAWSLQQKLLPSSGAAGDLFGSAVAIDVSTSTALVGAPQDDATATDAGAVYAFVRAGTTWSQQQKLVASSGSAGDLLGSSTGVQANRAVAGAYRRASNGTDSGAVYVFDRSGATWSVSQTITASDNASGDLFGLAVALGSDGAVVGASGKSGAAGAAYVFEVPPSPIPATGTHWTWFAGATLLAIGMLLSRALRRARKGALRAAGVSLVLFGAGFLACTSMSETFHGAAVGETHQALTDTVTLNVLRDTSVKASTPNTNFGTLATLDNNRALIQFDQTALSSAVGPTDFVVSAQLQVTTAYNPARRIPQTTEAYRLTQSWTEPGATYNCAVDSNTSNSTADCSGATAWSMGASPNPWATPSTAITVVPGLLSGAVVRYDVTADVRAFLHGTSTNFGWMLKGTNNQELVQFSSREGTTPPHLVLTIQRCTPAACDDGNACTQDTCDANGNCVNQVACGPSSFCNASGQCVAVVPPDPTTVATQVNRTTTSSLMDRTAFLTSGSQPIQTDLVPGTIDARRASVIRGRVLDKTNAPLSGVAVQVLSHPELGGTRTRSDGMFDLVVNGGGPLTLTFTSSGFVGAQRAINAPWNDTAVMDDLVLTAVDPAVSMIPMNTGSVQVAAGSSITDQNGTRQARLFFQPGTTAQLVFANGSTQSLDTMNVHVTEFTVGTNGPTTMPASLPASSGYTYAIDMTSDEVIASGAQHIVFSQPVSVYVDDFLSFPTGTVVPLGTYNRDTGAWGALPNGVIIQILSVTGGLADIDVTGSGTPANSSQLTALGFTDAERAKLATTYAVNTRLWRVLVPHFTDAADMNWPYGPSAGSGGGPPGPPTGNGPTGGPGGCGSFIEIANQTLGERVPVTGTSYALNYRSDRVPGRKDQYQLHIPITGTDPGSTTIRYDLKINVAGQSIAQSFTPSANLAYDFQWNGLDAYGRMLQGRQPATVLLSQIVPAVYLQPAAVANSFAQYSGTGATLSTNRARGTFSIDHRYNLAVGAMDTRTAGLGAWTLDVHHIYDSIDGVLYLGDGSRRQTGLLGNIVEQFAGIGVPLDNYEGVPSAQAEIYMAQAVAAAQDGTVYIADSQVILKVDPKTTIVHRFAGNQSGCSFGSGDGGPALNTGLCYVQDLTVAHDGSILIIQRGSNTHGWIRRVTPDGNIHTVAGASFSGIADQSCAFQGDGGAALGAEMCAIRSIAEAVDGTIYTIEGSDHSGNGRIRKITPDGMIHTLPTATFNTSVGSGNEGGVALGPDGSVYYTDYAGGVVRRITPDGVDKIFAGSLGVRGYAGDGGPATQAQLNFPDNVVVAPNGIVYIPEVQNDAIRVVTPDGVINTLAGGAQSPRNPPIGDGGPALQATFNGGLIRSALGPDGALYVGDFNNGEVRRIRPALPGGVLTAGFTLPSDDGRQAYDFDSSGRHLRTRHALTGATLYSFAYDSAGRLVTITDGDFNTTTIHHDTSGNPTDITGPYGHVTTLGVDANGFLSKSVDPASAETDFTYTSDGLMLTRTDPNAGVHSFQWDSQGRLARDQNPANGFQTLTRTKATGSETVTRQTAQNVVSTNKTEHLANLQDRRTFADAIVTPTVTLVDYNKQTEDMTPPDGTHVVTTKNKSPQWGMTGPIVAQSTTTTPGGIVLTATDAQSVTLRTASDPTSVQSFTDTSKTNNLATTTSYSGSNKTLTVTSPVGRTTTMQVDDLGRPVQMQVPGLAPINFSYDTRGRLIATTQDVRTTTNTYDASSNLSSVTDALNQTETYDHDAVGRVTARHRADGKIVSFAYDPMGNLTTVTPPGKPAHLFTYTPDNRLETYTAPDAGSGADVTGYAYDLDGHPTTVTRPDGSTVTMGYDSSGRMQTVTLPGGTMTLGYNATTGKLTSATGPYGVNLAYGYDGNLLTSTTWSGGVTGSVARTYDNFFRVATETVNGQAATKATLGYDNDGLVTSVATPAGSMSLTYDTTAPRLQTTTLGSVTDSRTYDQFGQVATYTAKFGTTVLYDVSYVRDPLGRIQQKTETIQGTTKVTQYGYDQVGRLITVAENGATVRQYTYDDNGNRTRFDDVQHSTSTTGTYDAQDRLLTYGTLTYTYTRDGALHTKTDSSNGQTTTYTYDPLGNLTHVALPDGRAIDYVIDGMGRRVGKKINGVLQKQWLYADDLRVVAELDGAGNVVSRFVWADGTGGSESAVTSVLTRLGLRLPDLLLNLLRSANPRKPLSTPAYIISGGALYRIVTDHIGTPRVSVNVATGLVGQRLDIDEWGKIVVDTAPGFLPFGFAVGFRDVDTEVIRFGARDFDPVAGRWIHRDPLVRHRRDVNLYAYASNDPVDFIDRSGASGECAECVGLTVGATGICLSRVGYCGGAAEICAIGCGLAGLAGAVGCIQGPCNPSNDQPTPQPPVPTPTPPPNGPDGGRDGGPDGSCGG
jgi:RHS repeat-associated protein